MIMLKAMRPALLVLAAVLAACSGNPPPAITPAANEPEAVEPDPAIEAPPAAMPLEPIEFPGFFETTLPNGMQLIVIENHAQPVATASLFVKSGGARDAPDHAGLAGMTAELLTKGAGNRTSQQIAETIEGAGGSLNAGAGADWTSVSTTALSDRLPLLLEVMSDVVQRPTFPEGELNTQRQRGLSGLQVELGQPGPIAERRFVREIYGDHPYASRPLPETLANISREDVQRFHRANFKPGNAVMVVSGDVTPERAQELASRHFGSWSGGAVAEADRFDLPAEDAAHISLVHRPGSAQSNIIVGHVGFRPDNPDYFALQVLNKILGGGSDSRLFQLLREQKSWTYGAYSQFTRPKDVGYFQASAEVRTTVTDSALVELMSQLRTIRSEAVSTEELEAAKSFLAGSFPLRLQTPGQIASQVAQIRLLGLPIEDLTEYREKINAVTAADVQRVAQEYVRPGGTTIVVVGDATKVLEPLEAANIAPITLYDVEGNPLDRAALEVTASTQTWTTATLEPMTLTYAIMVQGNSVGTATNALAKEGDIWVSTQQVKAGPTDQRTEVRFAADLTPVSYSMSVSGGPASIESQLSYANGRVTGEAKLPPQAGGDKTVDTEVVGGTLLPEMEAFALMVSDLVAGQTLTLPLYNLQSDGVVNATFNVTGTEQVTVPAGTFEAFRIEMAAGGQQSVLFVRGDAPHIVLKQEPAGQPVTIELQSVQKM